MGGAYTFFNKNLIRLNIIIFKVKDIFPWIMQLVLVICLFKNLPESPIIHFASPDPWSNVPAGSQIDMSQFKGKTHEESLEIINKIEPGSTLTNWSKTVDTVEPGTKWNSGYYYDHHHKKWVTYNFKEASDPSWKGPTGPSDKPFDP